MRFSSRIVTAVCVVSLAGHLRGQEMRPEFGKLASVPLCPAAVAGAWTHDIPIEGIDPPGEADRLAPGDSITALITLFEKGDKQSQWLLCIGAAEPTAEEKARTNKPPIIWYVGVGDKVEFSRDAAPVTLRLVGPFVEHAGKARAARVEDQRARIRVNKGFLGIGLDQAAEAEYRIRQNKLSGWIPVRGKPFTEAEIAQGGKALTHLPLSLNEQRAVIGAHLALESYAALVQEIPGLDNIFFKVVKPPSIWSIVWNLGVKVTLDLEKDVAPTGTAIWHLPPDAACYTYPLALRVNGKPALTTTLVVTSPRPPLLGCAGIVGMLAENPHEKDTYLILRIISARHRTDREHPTTTLGSGRSP